MEVLFLFLRLALSEVYPVKCVANLTGHERESLVNQRHLGLANSFLPSFQSQYFSIILNKSGGQAVKIPKAFGKQSSMNGFCLEVHQGRLSFVGHS